MLTEEFVWWFGRLQRTVEAFLVNAHANMCKYANTIADWSKYMQ